MKNFAKRFWIIVFIAIIGFLSASCKNDPLNGTTWKLTIPDDYSSERSITFNHPNITYTESNNTGYKKTSTGTYIISGSTVTLTISGESVTGALAGNQFTLIGVGEGLIFTKQ